MRLFIAVNFDSAAKDALYENSKALQKHTVRGSFTERNNYHMTLLFLGEYKITDIPVFIRLIDEACGNFENAPINIEISGLKTFGKAGEELLWAGLHAGGDVFSRLNVLLRKNLESLGYFIKDENEHFIPHVTVARKVDFWRMTSNDLDKIEYNPVYTSINSVTLMESTQTIKTFSDGTVKTNVIYNPLYEKIITQ